MSSNKNKKRKQPGKQMNVDNPDAQRQKKITTKPNVAIKSEPEAEITTKPHVAIKSEPEAEVTLNHKTLIGDTIKPTVAIKSEPEAEVTLNNKTSSGDSDSTNSTIVCTDCNKTFPSSQKSSPCSNKNCTHKAEQRCGDCTYIDATQCFCKCKAFFCSEKCSEKCSKSCTYGCSFAESCNDCAEEQGWKSKMSPHSFSISFDICPKCLPKSDALGKCTKCGIGNRQTCTNCNFMLCDCPQFKQHSSCDNCSDRWCELCTSMCVETCEGCEMLTGCNECVEYHMERCDDCSQFGDDFFAQNDY